MMKKKHKHTLIRISLIIGICLSGCSIFNQKLDINYVELYSLEYNTRTYMCTWPQDLITTNSQISHYSTISDSSLLNKIHFIMNDLSNHPIKGTCINARIVCLVHRSHQVDTLSFGWGATELNSISYKTLDTGMIRFIGYYLPKVHQEFINDYLRDYADRIKR